VSVYEVLLFHLIAICIGNRCYTLIKGYDGHVSGIFVTILHPVFLQGVFNIRISRKCRKTLERCA